jgi:hypothetical protein
MGALGPPGPPGKLPLVRVWNDGIHYEGDIVTHDGSTWQAQRDTGRSAPHEDWICLARSGRDGMDGTSFKICGTWDASKQYGRLDTVILNGGAFVAKTANPGPCPGDGWQLMASQGKQGKPGERGPVGSAGPSGKDAPAIVRMEVDNDGLIRLVTSDGSEVTCDLYPVLAKLVR